MAQPEATLSKKIVNYLNSLPYTIARKRHGTVFGVKGDPDIYCLMDSVHIEIEVKIGKNTPTDLQKKRLQEWEAAGAVVGVAYSLDDVKEIIAPYHG